MRRCVVDACDNGEVQGRLKDPVWERESAVDVSLLRLRPASETTQPNPINF
jgi:hypothetical protein